MGLHWEEGRRAKALTTRRPPPGPPHVSAAAAKAGADGVRLAPPVLLVRGTLLH